VSNYCFNVQFPAKVFVFGRRIYRRSVRFVFGCRC